MSNPPWHTRVTHQLNTLDQPTCHQKLAYTSLAYVATKVTFDYTS